jgi:hypothetical protein
LSEVRYLLATPKHQQRYATWCTMNPFPSALRSGWRAGCAGARYGFWVKIPRPHEELATPTRRSTNASPLRRAALAESLVTGAELCICQVAHIRLWKDGPPTSLMHKRPRSRVFSAPLCQAALREGASCESVWRILKTASETRLLRHRSASLRDLPSAIFLR